MNLEYNIVKMEGQIDNLKCEIASMKVKLKEQKKLELKGGNGYLLQATSSILQYSSPSTKQVSRGAFRADKELAEQADKNMVTRNRLEAHVHEIQGNGEGTWVIGHSHVRGYHLYDKAVKYLGAVYMKKETAEILCSALNNSEIEL